MDPHPAPRNWDGSLRRAHPRRSLRISDHSPSRLLRAGRTSRCRNCGNRVDWYQRTDDRPIALHPAELAADHVPPPCRWHLSGGIAHPHDDGSGWCRIPHAVLCAHRTSLHRLGPQLDALRRRLAVTTRRLSDSGTFTAEPRPPASTPTHAGDEHPPRPVLRILLTPYLSSHPIQEVRCIAQTRHRHRCTQPVLSLAQPAGRWRLLPIQPQHTQLALPDGLMAVYDLSHLSYSEQLRWRTQRCTVHSAAPGAADLALADWQPFNALLHTAHIHPRLPHPSTRPRSR
ncbi:DUF6083 domain-containing protein [Streptomyces sp. SAS_272]|uniref:DUF6083 domain-containing protein n=1 Tax=Streptomyces sp. SAS_272 TaxID=3412747 RepID=UPI00403CD302